MLMLVYPNISVWENFQVKHGQSKIVDFANPNVFICVCQCLLRQLLQFFRPGFFSVHLNRESSMVTELP